MPKPNPLLRDKQIVRLRQLILTRPQQVFLQNLQRHRVSIILGGNGAGKTSGPLALMGRAWAGMERTWMPPNARIMAIGISVKQAAEALQENIERYFPKCLVGSSVTRESLTSPIAYKHGGYFTVHTHGQGEGSEQGGRWHWIHCDENPPEPMFEEALYRLRPGFKTKLSIGMTPTLEGSWVEDRLITQAHELNVGWVESAVFENGLLRCATCQGVDTPGLGYDVCACDVPIWAEMPCEACHRDRATWDAILLAHETHRRDGAWLDAQIRVARAQVTDLESLACARCWTYGLTSRYPKDQLHENIMLTPDPDRLAMRLLGRFLKGSTSRSFTKDEIKALEVYAQSFVPQQVRQGEHWTQWSTPHPDHQHCSALDPSRGHGGNESVYTVLDMETSHQVGLWGSRDLEWTDYLPELLAIQVRYGGPRCQWNIEWGSAGDAVIPILQNQPGVTLCRPRNPLIGDTYSRGPKVFGQTTRVGFNTSTRSRQRILEQLVSALRRAFVYDPDGAVRVEPGRPDALYVLDLGTIAQLAKLQADAHDNDRLGVAAGDDDRIFALALAWECRLSQRPHGLHSDAMVPLRTLEEYAAETARLTARHRPGRIGLPVGQFARLRAWKD